MDINPYAPATPPPQQAILVDSSDRPIRFGGVVRHVDVARLRYSSAGTIISTLLLIIGALTGSFLMLGLLLGNPAAAAAVSLVDLAALGLVVVPLVVLPLVMLSRFRGRTAARLLEKRSPRIVGPVDGQLHPDLLELVYPESRTVIPLQSLTGVHVGPELIALTHDHRQLQLCILPRHLFEPEDFRRATQWLSPLAAERPLRPGSHGGLDARLWQGQPLELIAMPADAIAFSGTLLYSDFASTLIYREQMRQVYRFFIRLGVISAVLMLLVTAVFWDDPQVIMMLLAPILALFAFAVGRWLIRYKRHVPSGDHPVANISGWLSQQGLAYNSAVGSAVFQRTAFERIDGGQHSLQLILPGQLRLAVLVVERMFKSSDDFQQVRRWAEATAS